LAGPSNLVMSQLQSRLGRLRTYPGMEVRNPLTIEICQGAASIERVLTDVLALTKLDYNTFAATASKTASFPPKSEPTQNAVHKSGQSEPILWMARSITSFLGAPADSGNYAPSP
jgi:hypothetical protein